MSGHPESPSLGADGHPPMRFGTVMTALSLCPRRKSNRPLASRALLRRSDRQMGSPCKSPYSLPVVFGESLIAMQKVEGSNPISRLARDLALGRDFVAARASRAPRRSGPARGRSLASRSRRSAGDRLPFLRGVPIVDEGQAGPGPGDLEEHSHRGRGPRQSQLPILGLRP